MRMCTAFTPVGSGHSGWGYGTPGPLNFSPRPIPTPFTLSLEGRPQFLNSNRIISFADPHLLTPVTSYRYKNHRGQGGLSPSSNFQPSTFNSRLSAPPSLSPLSATLIDFSESVANKRLTRLLSPLDATLTKNPGGVTTNDWRYFCRELQLCTANCGLLTRSSSQARVSHSPQPSGIIHEEGATRFRRKLSRPEGMPGPTCPQLGGKLEMPTTTWHLQLN